MKRGKHVIQVSAAALEHNLGAIRHAASAGPAMPPGVPRTAVLAVIKADAYGHGAALCAPVLARAGADWLGVTDAHEGAAVRTALLHSGVPDELQPRILVMCGLQPADAPLFVAHHLTPVVWFPEQLTWLAAAAEDLAPGEQLPLHLEIDTGMSRQGVAAPLAETVISQAAVQDPFIKPLDKPAESPLTNLLDHLRSFPQLHLDGVLTHFSSAELAHSPETARQQHRFTLALAELRTRNLQPTWLHAGNTATLDEGRLLPWLHAEAASLGARLLVRSGLALFGYALPVEHGTATLAPHLRPVATWTTRIVALSDVPAGAAVGYNATFTAASPMRLALLPIGYADGLRRELSRSSRPLNEPQPAEQPERQPYRQPQEGGENGEGGWVIIRGHRAPVVGRVSMNLTTVDVTGIPGAALGDEVTLLGPGISAEDHARIAGTIPYEILCNLRGDRELVD